MSISLCEPPRKEKDKIDYRLKFKHYEKRGFSKEQKQLLKDFEDNCPFKPTQRQKGLLLYMDNQRKKMLYQSLIPEDDSGEQNERLSDFSIRNNSFGDQVNMSWYFLARLIYSNELWTVVRQLNCWTLFSRFLPLERRRHN